MLRQIISKGQTRPTSSTFRLLHVQAIGDAAAYTKSASASRNQLLPSSLSAASRGCQLLEQRRHSRLIRRKITRLESDYELDDEELARVKRSANDALLAGRLINRNPRNLEQLLFEPKPLGWELEDSSPTYWNKLEILIRGKHLTAKIVHHSGRMLISVSSNDATFAELLGGKSGLQSMQYLAAIMARRCLESGINYVYSDLNEANLKSSKAKTFIAALRENGLLLKEPEVIHPRRTRDL